MSITAKSFAAAVNHLLNREPWARQQLAAYAGRRARLIAGTLQWSLSVDPDGRLAAHDAQPSANGNGPETVDDVTITVLPQMVNAFVTGGRAAAMRQVRIAGDAEFAAAIGRLAEQLRWEPEEDLSRFVGDIAAGRIVGAARGAFAGALGAARDLAQAATEYWLYENPTLVPRSALADHALAVSELRDDVERLEKRIARCARQRQPGPGAAGAGAGQPSKAGPKRGAAPPAAAPNAAGNAQASGPLPNTRGAPR